MTAAHSLIDIGFVPVRVKYRDKLPIGDAWQTLRPTHEDVTAWGECNVGVLLGTASNGLTDIDLDCIEAVQLAHHYLLPTWVFGRASKPRSHWLYVTHGARSKMFRGPDNQVMLEIRSDTANGPGNQTVVPPSVHTSGELIEWDPDSLDGAEGPRVIDAAELNTRVAQLARATVLVRNGASEAEAIAFVEQHTPKARVLPTKVRRVQPKRDGDDLVTCLMCKRTEKAKDTTHWPAAQTCSEKCLIDRARRYLAKCPESISGQGGHNALFRAAIALVKGFGFDQRTALDLLDRDFNPRCQPPWQQKDLERKVGHADTVAKKEDGYLLGEVA